MSTSVLGYNISMPIMVAPTALHKMAHPEGISFLSIHFVFLLAYFIPISLYGRSSEMQESLLLLGLQLL
jgi:isopentenyl diphosphate isomerase/L-lactate dehydrogenase-like FMN-dependent dehydrogenase